jgi:hypothetical protein
MYQVFLGVAELGAKEIFHLKGIPLARQHLQGN